MARTSSARVSTPQTTFVKGYCAITIPALKLPNPLNGSHGHWSVASRRRRSIRTTVGWALILHVAPRGLPLPLTVTVTRLSRGTLDAHDGLPASCKPVIDAVATWLGIDDADPRVTWQVRQEKAAGFGVRIEIRRRDT